MQKALTSRDRNVSGAGAVVRTMLLPFSYCSSPPETPHLANLRLVCWWMDFHAISSGTFLSAFRFWRLWYPHIVEMLRSSYGEKVASIQIIFEAQGKATSKGDLEQLFLRVWITDHLVWHHLWNLFLKKGKFLSLVPESLFLGSGTLGFVLKKIFFKYLFLREREKERERDRERDRA